jgi:hypothetical protein
MKLFAPKTPSWTVVWEVPTENQDRALAFVRDLVTQGQTECSVASNEALKLFGQAFLVNLFTGERAPVCMFERIAPNSQT